MKLIRISLVWFALLLPLTAAAAASVVPNFNGLWRADGVHHALLTTDGRDPPLLPAAQATYGTIRAAIKAGHSTLDKTQVCLPPGVTRSMMASTAFEIVQNGDTLAFLFRWNHLSRWVYIGRSHFEPLGPAYFGQSVAIWDGSTLVIDSTDFNADTLLDDSGLPHSAQLHLTEHLSLLDPDHLQDRLRIEDPQNFTAPWETVLRFHRVSGPRVTDDDWCIGRSGVLKQSH